MIGLVPTPQTFLILGSYCGRVCLMTKYVLIRSTIEQPVDHGMTLQPLIMMRWISRNGAAIYIILLLSD